MEVWVNMNDEFKKLKERHASEFVWNGKYDNYIGVEIHNINLKREHVKICIEVSLEFRDKKIAIRCSEPIAFEKLFDYLCSVRKYEYLFDGTFYETEMCTLDGENITEIIKKYEVGYFRCSKSSYRIHLDLPDKNYTKCFRSWLILEKQLSIINQMMLYADNVSGLTADLRLAMISQVYEPLAKFLEKKKIIKIQKESGTKKEIECDQCKNKLHVKIPGKKTFASCLLAVFDYYGKPIFKTEYGRRKRLIKHIVKTRNKVFHVNRKQKESLKGYNSGFYVIKMELLYRYILLLLIGIEQKELDESVSKIVEKMERRFPNGILK